MTSVTSAIATGNYVANMASGLADPVLDSAVSAGGYLAFTSSDWGGPCCVATCTECPADTAAWM